MLISLKEQKVHIAAIEMSLLFIDLGWRNDSAIKGQPHNQKDKKVSRQLIGDEYTFKLGKTVKTYLEKYQIVDHDGNKCFV